MDITSHIHKQLHTTTNCIRNFNVYGEREELMNVVNNTTEKFDRIKDC